ncbi:hypothetical protein FGO68_gene13058 [Halteria grandinella]|uniref:NADP-dependent oxidoreductase domain-containing protein n=1 Tax=Halteria grandinella TaxID=5974 RepID=A0A8J8NKZ0_HALGN|nr:hypothetical protein FGO68_gene13058 [Halteria grandinella]
MEQALTQETVHLSNSARMPLIGLGTFQLMEKEPITNAIVNLGYRHIDTAWLYQNEELIGEAIKDAIKAGVKREELFITTKIWPTQFEDPEKALRGSLERLQLDYVDLYLIHWPATFFSPSKKPLHILWAQLESLVDKNLTVALGLSNFNIQLTSDLLTYARIRPVCNQVELHPYCAQAELVRFMKDQSIVPVAYCPLGRPSAAETPGNQEADLKYAAIPDLREDKGIVDIAKRVGKSEFQVLLKWGLQRGCAVIPKSSQAKNQKENLDLQGFTLSEEEMAYISGKDKGLRICNKFDFLGGYDIFA